MASLMWTTAFYVLCVEICLIGLCCIPSARWREIVVKIVTSNFFRTISHIGPWVIGAGVLLLLESMWSYSSARHNGERLQENHVTGSSGQYEARMYRAQRNTYIAGSLLFCMFVLREFYWYMNRCVQADHELTATKKQLQALEDELEATRATVTKLQENPSLRKRAGADKGDKGNASVQDGDDQ
eukprot:m.12942 g.12942  ORF g.12942 m.12942 type:complete len:184 (-) comp10058_c0_seq1:63-614(-)